MKVNIAARKAIYCDFHGRFSIKSLAAIYNLSVVQVEDIIRKGVKRGWPTK